MAKKKKVHLELMYTMQLKEAVKLSYHIGIYYRWVH